MTDIVVTAVAPGDWPPLPEDTPQEFFQSLVPAGVSVAQMLAEIDAARRGDLLLRLVIALAVAWGEQPATTADVELFVTRSAEPAGPSGPVAIDPGDLNLAALALEIAGVIAASEQVKSIIGTELCIGEPGASDVASTSIAVAHAHATTAEES